MQIKNLTLALMFSLLFSSATTPTQIERDKAVKFDEFGDIYSSDLKARLDNFAMSLTRQPKAKGFIMVYRSRRDIPGLNIQLAVRMKEYLINTRGLAKEIIVTVDGGVASSLIQELWIVPPNTAPIPREDSRIGYLTDPNEAWKFLDYGYPTPDEIRRFNMSNEYDVDDQYLEAFVEQVKKRKSNTACVIVYAQYNPKGELVDYLGDYEPVEATRLDPPGTAATRMLREVNVLIKQLGLSADRIRTIDGGYRKRRTIELWVVPGGEPLPVATPNSYPKGRRGASR